MDTDILEKEDIQLKEKVVQEHHLVLFNDDVNTFEDVIELLIKVCGHDPIQAEQCTFIVHYNGKCSVKKGTYKELERISGILLDKGLTVEIN